MNIREALFEAVSKLKSFELPNMEASILLCHTLDITKEQLYTSFNNPLTQKEEDLFFSFVKRRINGEPSAYITGHKEFYSRDFSVSSDVLIPRPDTEILVEKAIELYKKNSGNSILDLCTGSGCIAVTLALELPGSEITAADISPAALAVFKENCCIYVLDIQAVQSDLFQSISSKFSMIVSNPPYVKSGEVDGKVKDGLYEPALALTAGEDGLEIIKEIIPQSLDYLLDDGYLLLEAGFDQCEIIRDLMIQAGYTETGIKKDLAGRNRVIYGRKDGNTIRKI